ncbi:ribosome biogenesis GTPase YlqF [Mycoplasmopsis gallopavonis]|uniref:Ribosome biogenesis GTPase A n=1 Tax=Mycoplasmopsis gallopavonis TaxID=76629 RepID=A0A449AYE2_9BACT|nr:ribosome biogenesis GTPase YlqF [Mycoplasmopsis gallopavonis]RIV16241.1 ribosome biogenesis GTPase YlqF [Mycoplasmopsis gallopavonis]VEU72548.1 ribosomal biogenesis GTPase [Mycoplasmopsis gallopavonis]
MSNNDIKLDENYQNLIQWFPGHMAKAMRDIKENANLCDVFIVVLDARCPISSYNEDFDAISPQKPRLFIVTKSDLMDKSKKDQINQRFQGENILWLDLRKASSKKIILNKLKQIMQAKINRDKAKGLLISRIKSFVVGVPNCGKSTLINLVSEKAKLKVANYPGVTREKKWVVNGEFLFMDTPGILLPKFDDQEIAVKLLTIGSIKLENFPTEFSAIAMWKLLSKYYPEKLTKLGFEPSFSDQEIYGFFHDYAEHFKFFKEKGKVDLDKAQKHFINYCRNLNDVTYD